MTQEEVPRRLARFRADPERVRIAIQPSGGGWSICIEPRGGGVRMLHWCRGPVHISDELLEQARDAGIAGIDVYMAWAYPHPQRS